MYKCRYCQKEYKTKKGLELHLKTYCKKKPKIEYDNEELKDISSYDLSDNKKVVKKIDNKKVVKNEKIEKFIIENTEIEKEDIQNDIIFKLIKFFENTNLENIHLNGKKLEEFKDLYKEYYGIELRKTCADGIVHSYSRLYYQTQKLKINYEKS